jgi:hypothetical protein
VSDPSTAIVLAAVLLTLAVLLGWPTRSRSPSELWSASREARIARGHGPAPTDRRTVEGPASASASASASRSPPSVGSPPTTDEIAASMVLLAVALQSGCGVVEAVEEVADTGTDPAARQLAVVAAAWRWGVSDREAWSVVDARWSRVELSLRLAATSGVAPSSLLLEGADDLWSARLADLDIAAARVAVRLVLPLGAAFLPAFVLTTVVPVVLALTRQVLAP